MTLGEILYVKIIKITKRKKYDIIAQEAVFFWKTEYRLIYFVRLQKAFKDKSNPIIDEFIEKCVSVFSSYFTILGHNKARQREKLGQLFFEFSKIQAEVSKIIYRPS